MKTLPLVAGLGISLMSSLLAAPAPPAGAPAISPEYYTVLRSGDPARLLAALGHGADVNARDAAGNTPLMLAAIYGNAQDVQLLLDRGAEVNAANTAGATALMRASFDFTKVRLLVEHRADVNARSALGNTALLLAARPANSHRTVEFLLAHGADAKATNLFGASALMAAAAGGDAKSMRLLLGHGADVNAQPTPDEPGFIFGGGRTALMWSAFRGDIAALNLLLDAGADVNAITGLGTALAHAAWADRKEAARLLIERGARVDLAGPKDGYTALHWAASTDGQEASLVKLLLARGANPNLGGGENVDAFLDTLQTPLMLAGRRGDTPILAALRAAGATNCPPDRARTVTPPVRQLADPLDAVTLRAAIGQAVPRLERTALKSKESFVNHASRQDCTSCHSQYLPLAAMGLAKKQHVAVDSEAERRLVKIVGEGELKNVEVDWQPLFHPEAVHTKGYELFAYAAADLPADATTDSWVHHLAAIQGLDGQWYNNLPRPPIQTDDISATALAVQALQRYAMPGRKAEFAAQVSRARRWLWRTKPDHTEARVYQILGLAWAGEPASKLQSLADALLREQRSDGGWAQLPGLTSDAYATGQAIYALRIGAGLPVSHPAIDQGLRHLLATQLDDGTWYVHRRAFPFQPTMDSGFPHGRDSWISTAATSWAVLALSLPAPDAAVASAR